MWLVMIEYNSVSYVSKGISDGLLLLHYFIYFYIFFFMLEPKFPLLYLVITVYGTWANIVL